MRGKREQEARRRNMECGLSGSWVEGSSLPPQDTRRALRSTNRKDFTITETLFVDDTTLRGNLEELKKCKEVVKEVLWQYEEKCHPGKEENIQFGT